MTWQPSQHSLINRKNCDWTLILREHKNRQDPTASPTKQGDWTSSDNTAAPTLSSLQCQQYPSVSGSDLWLQPCYANHSSSAEQEKPWILVTSDTDTFRALAKTQIVTRHVLEIGCSTGGTSAIVWNLEHVQTWIGFDTSTDMVESVQERLKSCPHLHKRQARRCIQINPLLDPQLAASEVYSFCTSQTHTTNVHTDKKSEPITVIVDIGGNREEAAVILMLQWILAMFPNSCRQIIVKSQTIHAALLDLTKRGEVEDVNHWFQLQQIQAMRASIPKHPLQAAKKFVMDHSEDPWRGRRLICRYHNYHEQGCKKFNDKATVCPFDHEHCHLCCQRGHIARNCPCIQ